MFELFDLIVKGGWVMIPIGICSVLALAIAIERSINLNLEKTNPPEFVAKIKRLLIQGRINEVIALCNNSPHPVAGIIEAAILKRHQDRDHIKEAIVQAGKEAAQKLHKYVGALATIGSISPSLGLLGTVTGMIGAFQVISAVGPGNPQAVSGDIAEALVTTAAGLIVAIPTIVAHNYLYKNANHLVLQMENISLELLDILSEGKESVRLAVNGKAMHLGPELTEAVDSREEVV